MNKKSMQPSEIAREALKRLTARKLPPTPVNFQACYNEIAAVPNVAGFPEAQVRRIALALTARNPAQKEQLDLLDAAISRHSWQGMEAAVAAFDKLAATVTAVGEVESPAVPEGDKTSVGGLLARVVRLTETLLPALGNDDEFFSELVAGLLQTLRDPNVAIAVAESEIDAFTRRLSFVAEEQAEIRQALLRLLHLVIENISKLLIEETWLEGQIDALLSAVKPPLSLRRLDDVERRIEDVMRKQAAAKERSVQAQEEMRQMLGAFIDRLSLMTKSSATFKESIEATAKKIETVKSVEDLAPLLNEVLSATRTMAEETAKAHDQLHALQETVLATEAELAELHRELNAASALARHDPLTNTLNRKGLDEALAREIANMRRKDTSLSIAMLDVDNFKKINDKYGHDTGDAALVHLVKIVRECIRPTDSVARYGGEEFLILMPETRQDDAMEVMVRLQRGLTKEFFLAGNEKVLITFSAGVTQMTAEETGEEAIKRADQAMYLAKRSGKNRVACR